jgi:hypothetical protein
MLMRHALPAVLLVLAAACGTPDPPQEPNPDAPDPVVMKLREGVAPVTLGNDKNAAWLSEIAAALAEDRPWKSESDALNAVAYFARHAGPDEVPVIETLLTSEKPERRMRGLFIVRMSRDDATLAPLLRNLPNLLHPGTVTVARVALGALGQRGVRTATEAILDYYEATDDPLALRALGRIWQNGGEDPLRTAVLILVHAEAMGPSSSEAAVGAMLRIMNEPELDEFLAKWVPETFPGRTHVILAAGEKGFDAGRGAKIHGAFLKSPDPVIVSTVLWRSPHRLDAAAVRALLGDDRIGETGARVCDYAAARLESMETGLPLELPADADVRERRLKKWKARGP